MAKALAHRPEDSPLTSKQALFVEEFLVDFNATQAAVRARYSQASARVIGQENLQKPAILAHIRRRQAELFEAVGDAAVMARLALVRALADPDKAVYAAKAILDIHCKERALALKERELALKTAPDGSDAARVVYVEEPPAADEAQWDARVGEELANVRGSARRH